MDAFVPTKDVQNLRRIRDRNPVVVEEKVPIEPAQVDDDDDSEDEPPPKKQAKTSATKSSPRPHTEEKGEKWELHYRAMQDFCANNVGKLPRQKLVYEFEGQRLNLGSFVDVLKQRHRGTGGRTPLSEDEKSMLEIMPAWITGRDRVDVDEHWDLMCGLLKDYEKKEGKLPTTRSKEQFQGYEVKEVGIWVQTQKKRFEIKGGLHPMREDQLQSMREVPAWIAYEEKVSKRVAQAAQAAQVAQAAAEEEGVAAAVEPSALSALSIFKGKKSSEV